MDDRMQPGIFVSIDWGTSNFRMRLVEKDSLRILEQKTEPVGIKALYRQWQAEGGDRETRLIRFVEARRVSFRHPIPPGTGTVISGMASSDIGLRELPYRMLPMKLEAAGLSVARLNYPECDLDIRLISGLCTERDIMRGEETQLVGLADQIDPLEKTVIVLPGTHSKHVYCHQGFIHTFRTLLSGELFDLLTSHSVLSGSVRRSGWTEAVEGVFKEGITDAVGDLGVLGSVFRVRAWDRLGKKSPEENYYYLSGLIIGSELNTLTKKPAERIIVAAPGELSALYRAAADYLGLADKTTHLSANALEHAVLKTHEQVAVRNG
jgi:2-dehydro-3-deoxygalactonokinase